eukprot:TRINITY_DN24403_c0_g1_i7.p1 TRINITY_DN24403_c0_g1~~TRINITY_DN24403_c0_g1_i7.p1  ORF type:complete len:402 (+),score=68.45 TRINITY_DN24403_c0_g1_i7:171-1376(+)
MKLESVAAAGIGACLGSALTYMWLGAQRKDMMAAHGSVDECKAKFWGSIRGALDSAGLYIGDKLRLFAHLPLTGDAEPITPAQLAEALGLNERWCAEWLAQLASARYIVPHRSPDGLRYSIQPGYAHLLADEQSDESCGMIQAIPALLNRARDLPESFRSGVGVPYNDLDISEAIDRHHSVTFRTTFLPCVLPTVQRGQLVDTMQHRKGFRVADLGCGSGSLLIALATEFRGCEYHGFEVSAEAIQVGRHKLAAAQLEHGDLQIHLHGPESKMEGAGQFDCVFTYDVLHDATNPRELMRMVKAALVPGGCWLVADICCHEGVEQNVFHNPKAGLYYGMSLLMCMSSALSEPGGLGLGTLGFCESVATSMFRQEGFSKVEVLAPVGPDGSPDQTARYFLVQV